MRNTGDLQLVDDSDEVEVLGDIRVPRRFFDRISLGVPVLDEVFGGPEMPGILRGTSFLMTGVPGAGKSTMALQLADQLQQRGHSVLYNMGEENKHMVRLRAERIGLRQQFCVSQFQQVDRLVEFCAENGVEVLFQDSIQSLHDGGLDGHRMLKNVVKKLHRLSKDHEVTMFLIGHSTKSGQFAGPQEIKHDADAHAHISLSPSGSRVVELQKNRFGPACVPYEFSLSAQGLDFQAASTPTVDAREGRGESRAAQRREDTLRKIREALLAGDSVSGYCFERLRCDVSGGFFRALIVRASQQLADEGHRVVETKVGGRTHVSLSKKEV